VPATLSWVEGTSYPVDAARLDSLLVEAASAAAGTPVIVAIRVREAEITIVVGDEAGTTLVYFPPEYAHTQVGSLLSVGDHEAARDDRWEPPAVADYFGHYTEFPHWSVIPFAHGEQALREFLEDPATPPPSITWESD
jgi:hypothetical protein